MLIPKNAIKVFGGVKFDVYQWNQTLFDGSSKILELLVGQDASQVLVIFEDGDIGLCYEEQSGRGSYFSLMGGVIEDGEKPETTALRELREEGGIICKSIDLFNTYKPAGGINREFYCYIARGCRIAHKQSLSPAEKIHILKLNTHEFMEIISSQEFRYKDFALDILKAYYKGGIMQVRIELGMNAGEMLELMEKENIGDEYQTFPEMKTLKKTKKRLAKVTKKAKAHTKKKPVKAKAIRKALVKPKKKLMKTIKKTTIKPKKKLAKVRTVKTKKTPKKTVPKSKIKSSVKYTSWQNMLKGLKNKAKKRQVELEEPLF